ncbi:MAG: hypothetical protein U1A78_36020 [Polyangia bacterium]
MGRKRTSFSCALGVSGLIGATVLAACSPYPDDGEFLAGVVYSQNFLNGVKTIDRLPVVGAGRAADAEGLSPYALIATTRGMAGTTTAQVPFWTDNGKRNPLATSTAQKVYFFDGSCATPGEGYRYDERLDLIRLDRQYPIFEDIPEVLSSNGGKAGRRGAYSAVVEVIHVRAPGDIPCQSIKRFDTVTSRIGQDLTEVRREYRLYQIVDPALVPSRSLPTQLGFFDQLVVPYIDMGPVPLEADGKTFATMPIYKVYKGAVGNTAAMTVVFGTASEPLPMLTPPVVYSPICRDFTLTMQSTLPPPDAGAPVYRTAMKTETLSSCIVCRLKGLDSDGAISDIDCPFSQSQVGGQ